MSTVPGVADGTSDIELESAKGVAVAWFARPRVLNAFRRVTFDRMHEVLDQVATDDTVHALVLTGRGRAFSAGEDLDEMAGAADAGFDIRRARADLERLQHLTRRIAAYPKPVIAAINGPAVGLGAELPLACAVRLASPSAYFFFSEPRRGMLPTNGTFHLLPAIIGQGRAADWLLTARRVPASEALEAGFVSAVVAADDLVERAVEWSRAMAVVESSELSRSAD